VIEYRWAGNQADRLPALAAELVQLRVAVIVAAGLPPALAAKAASTSSIPIAFGVGADAVQLGLVASLNRPGGNLTGFNAFATELGAKGLALLHELVPSTAAIGFLVNPNNPASEVTTRDVLAAAPVMGLKIEILKAGTDREIDAAFVSLAKREPGRCSSVLNFSLTVGSSRSLHLRHVMRFRLCTRIVSSWWLAGSSVTE
jgi:putative ABC transport system substrate-binding protein